MTILDDSRREGAETVYLILADPSSGAVLGSRATAVLTLRDDTSDLQPGDVNGDGEVNLADIITTMQIMTMTTVPSTELHIQADVNGDGRIGMADLVFILKKYAGRQAP